MKTLKLKAKFKHYRNMSTSDQLYFATFSSVKLIIYFGEPKLSFPHLGTENPLDVDVCFQIIHSATWSKLFN